MVQYLLPCAIELSYVYALQKGNVVHGILREYYLTVAVSTVIIIVSLRGMLFTGMFFHTGSESAVALFIVFVFAYLPAFFLSTYFPFHVKEIIPKSEDKKNM